MISTAQLAINKLSYVKINKYFVLQNIVRHLYKLYTNTQRESESWNPFGYETGNFFAVLFRNVKKKQSSLNKIRFTVKENIE